MHEGKTLYDFGSKTLRGGAGKLVLTTIAALALASVVLLPPAPAQATLLGSMISISDGGTYWPSVCYNAYSDQCLALWVDVRETGWQLKGRRIDASDGDLLGSEFYVSPLESSVIGNAAYNSSNYEWMVAYQGTIYEYDDVVGQRIASDGTKVGGYLSLVAKSGYQNGSHIAYDSANNRYLVVWMEKVGSYRQVMGRFFSATGSAVSSEFQIRDSGAIYDGYGPRIAYNPYAEEFMVVWQDGRNYIGEGQDNDYADIYGQRIDADTMAKIGNNIAIYWGGSPYVPNGQDNPGDIACNPNDGRYCIGITKLTALYGWTTYGLVINTNGSWYSNLFTVTHPDFGTIQGVEFNDYDDTYVFVCQASGGFKARRYSAAGVPIGTFETIMAIGAEAGDLAVRGNTGEMLYIGYAADNHALKGQRFNFAADTVAPGNVNPLRAYRQSDTSVLLTWANPSDLDYYGTMVRYRTDTYPTSTTDGTLVCNRTAASGSSDSYTHAVSAGVTYYYTAFAYDGSNNYASGTQAVTSSVWLNETFDSYGGAYLDGQGGWLKDPAKTSVALQGTTTYGGSAKAAEILGTSTTYDDAYLSNFGSITGGCHKISFYMRRNASATNNQAILEVWNGDNKITRVYWSTEFQILTGPGATFYTLVSSPVSNQWYFIEILFDMSAKTMKIWRDSALIATGVPFYSTAATAIDKVSLTGYSGATTASYLDSVKGEKVDCPTGDDVTPPGPVTDFVATSGDTQVGLSWTNPTDSDFQGTMIRCKTTGFPTSPTDGTQVCNKSNTPGSNDSYTHTGLTNGTTYYYSAFAYDEVPNYAAAPHASATPADTLAPGPVTDFKAMSGDTQNILSWSNPGDGDFAGVVIRYKTSGFPTSPTDGTQCYSGSATSYTHTGLTNGTTYYYSAYAKDEVPNYSTAANASAKPAVRPTISESTFDSDAQGWSIAVWKSGPYADGTMAWSSSAGNPGGGMRSTGSGATESTSRCTREGGEIYKTISTADYENIQISYQLRVNSLGTEYSGYGTNTCPVDHDLIEEQLTIFYSTDGGDNWTEAEYITRPTLLNYQSYGTRYVDLSSITGCNDNEDFAVRFRWQFNTSTDTGDLDNIKITGNSIPQGDTTPPGAVSSFTATSGDTQNSLSWTNPSDEDFAGTMIRFKTTGYPTSATDGTLVCNRTAAPSSNDSYTHTGLTNNTTYYYAAFAYDEIPNYSSSATASAAPADVTAPGSVTGFSATSGDMQNSLSWTNPTDGDFAGTRIVFKTSGYPTSPTDGTLCYSGPGTSYDHTGLTNNTTYYYAAYAYDEVPNYATAATANATPADVTAPAAVTGFSATAGDNQNVLDWTNPSTADFAGTMIRYRTDTYPTGPTNGTLVCSKTNAPGAADTFTHTDLTNGVTYYYAAFAYDEVPNYSTSTTTSGTPVDVVAPDAVTGFIASTGNTQVKLVWTNPGNIDFVGTKVRYSTTGYPTSPTDGLAVCDQAAEPGSDDSYTHTGLTNGVTYYYAAFAYDEVPNYASSATDDCTPTVGTINVKAAGTITIDGGTSDWSLGDFTTYIKGGDGGPGDIALVGYYNGDLYMSGHYTSYTLPTSASDHTAKVYSRHDATYQYFLVRLDDDDIRTPNGVSSNWANDCVEFYIDPSHNHGSSAMSSSTSDVQLVIDAANQKNVYVTTSGYATQVLGGVSSAVSTDGSGWWLEVRITKSVLDPDLPSSGTFGIDFSFRDNDNNNDPTLSTVYSWNDTEESGSFPSKIPDRWGNASLAAITPGAPTVTSPSTGSTVTTTTPTIQWSGDAHDKYEVHISQQNDSSTTTNGWDSGEVSSSGNSATSGTLRDFSFYYVFVRLHNDAGWGPWSAAGHCFTVRTNSSNGTVYLGNALPTASGWSVYDVSSYENSNGITSTIVSDGGSNVWKLYDNSTSNRCKERYVVTNISFDTGASLATGMRVSGLSGSLTYNVGISNGNVGGMFLRHSATDVKLVDINGNVRGTYSLDATTYHKYQLTVKNSTQGNNSTAVWRVYVDGTQRISWTGAGVHNGFDGFMAGNASTGATGYWYYDWIAGRSDGQFSPSQWDPVY